MGEEATESVERFLLPPGYTQIPNPLLDELLADAGLAEFKVTVAIARHTFGWKHTPERLFTNEQLCGLTELSRQSVTEGLKRAEARGFVGKRHAGGNKWVYGIRVKKDDPSYLLAGQATRKLSPDSQPCTNTRGIQGTETNGASAPPVRKGDKKAKGRRDGGALFKADPEDPVDAVIVELFELWKSTTNQPENAQLTNRRAGMLRSRLREQARGYSDRDAGLAVARTALVEAIEGWANAKWYREREAFGFTVGLESYDKVEKFRGEYRNQQRGSEQAAAFADYDQAVG